MDTIRKIEILIGGFNLESIKERVSSFVTPKEKIRYLENLLESQTIERLIMMVPGDQEKQAVWRGYLYSVSSGKEIEKHIAQYKLDKFSHLFYVGHEHYVTEHCIKKLILDLENPSEKETGPTNRDILIKAHKENGGRLTTKQIQGLAKDHNKSPKKMSNIYGQIRDDIK